jgi:hypothetical protein
MLNGNSQQYIQSQKQLIQQNSQKTQNSQQLILQNINAIDFPDQNIYNRSTGFLTCPSSFQKEYTFCHLDTSTLLQTPNYQCSYQKSNQIYPAPSVCCKPSCTKQNLLSKLQSQQNLWIPNKQYYYCIDKNFTCQKHLFDPYHPERNTCGQNMLSQTPIPSYPSLEQCQSAIRCETILNKNKCLDVPMCGWCTDESGNGKCVDGTPEGPIRQNIYYYCRPDRKDDINTYTYATPNTYDFEQAENISPSLS